MALQKYDIYFLVYFYISIYLPAIVIIEEVDGKILQSMMSSIVSQT